MAAAVDESPVWKPRTTTTAATTTTTTTTATMVLTLPCQIHNHFGHSGATAAYGSKSGAHLLPNYHTYNASGKQRSEYALCAPKPGPHAYSDATWPRSAARPSQSVSDPLLNRAAYSPTSPARGVGLHPIRERSPPTPAALRGQRSSTVCPGERPSSVQPTMKNGLSTTVPQNMIPRSAAGGHRASAASRSSRFNKLTSTSRETWEVRCCRISVLLVIMQICLGVTVTALAFYMERLSSSIPTKECPYWAGIPLLTAGVLGIYFCATDFVAYSASTRAFIIKVLCFVLSTVCVFLCMVAAVFPGIHGHRIPTYGQCKYVAANFTCVCVQPLQGFPREFPYRDIIDCVTVTTSVKDILILQCALNAVASGVCLWFVTLLWKKRYEQFHSGLRFYSYSASVPPHP